MEPSVGPLDLWPCRCARNLGQNQPVVVVWCQTRCLLRGADFPWQLQDDLLWFVLWGGVEKNKAAYIFSDPGFVFFCFFFPCAKTWRGAEWLSFLVRTWWPQYLFARGSRAPTPSSVIDCSHPEHSLNHGLIISFFYPSFPHLTQILQKYHGQRNGHSPNTNVCICRHCRRPHLNLFIYFVNCRAYSWWGLWSPEHLSWEMILSPWKMTCHFLFIPF